MLPAHGNFMLQSAQCTAMANISQCGTGCLARQNKPFRPAKQPVLQRKNDAATNRLAIKQLAATPLKVSNTQKTLHCSGRYWRPACIRAHPDPGLPACQPLASSPLCSSSRRLFRRLRHRPQRRGPCRWLPRRQRHPWANPRR